MMTIDEFAPKDIWVLKFDWIGFNMYNKIHEVWWEAPWGTEGTWVGDRSLNLIKNCCMKYTTP